MDSTRHVIGCHVITETRVQIAFCDVVISIHQSLLRGGSFTTGRYEFVVESRADVDAAQSVGHCRLSPGWP